MKTAFLGAKGGQLCFTFSTIISVESSHHIKSEYFVGFPPTGLKGLSAGETCKPFTLISFLYIEPAQKGASHFIGKTMIAQCCAYTKCQSTQFKRSPVEASLKNTYPNERILTNRQYWSRIDKQSDPIKLIFFCLQLLEEHKPDKSQFTMYHLKDLVYLLLCSIRHPKAI